MKMAILNSEASQNSQNTIQNSHSDLLPYLVRMAILTRFTEAFSLPEKVCRVENVCRVSEHIYHAIPQDSSHGVAAVSRIDKMIGLFFRIASLL